MHVVKLYNGIYKTLANDTEILNLLEISEGTNLDKARSIQKRHQPQNVADNMPLIAFYTPGGSTDIENDLVFGSTFVFDIYTKDDVEKAHLISNRIFDLFYKTIPNFEGVQTFEPRFEDNHESATDLANTYCFTIILSFFITLEK